MTATNGIGWEVQMFTYPNGWRAVSKPYATIALAKAALAASDLQGELRVYEALKTRSA